MIVTKIVEIFSHEITVPVGGMTLVVFLMVCDILRKLHNYPEKMENQFDIYGKIEKYEELAKEAGANLFSDYYEVKEKVLFLKEITLFSDTDLE